MLNIYKKQELANQVFKIIFIEIVGDDKYKYVGSAWARPENVRFETGWELKDIFNKSIFINEIRFAVLVEIIDKSPNYVFIIRL